MYQVFMKEKKTYPFPLQDRQQTPFKVPEGYFETLSDRVMDRIREEESGTKVRLWKIIRPQLALAAAILGFALISFTLLRIFVPGTGQVEYYDLASLEEMGYFYDESTLMEMVPSDEEEISEDDLWVDEAIEYLAGNDMSFYQIIDEIE